MPIYTSAVSSGSSTSTVGDLVDRVYRDYLEPGDDQAVLATVSGAVLVGGTEIVYGDATFAPDEEDLLAPGVLIEVGIEQMRITDVDDATNTLTVVRGVNGTEAAAIADGAEIRVAPLYSRRSVFDAVADNIVGLYPDLTFTSTATVTTASSPVEVPAEIVAVGSARRLSGSSMLPVNAELVKGWPPAMTTGTAIIFSGTPAGETVYITYEGRFARPETEDEVVGDLGVDAAWERIIVVGAAAQVVAGRDLDPLSQEYIVEQMEAENLPVGSGQRVRNGLLQLHQAYMTQARRNLRADRVTPVVVYR